MFTKEQLLQIIPDVPDEFSIEDLLAILNRPSPEQTTIAFATRPTNLSTEEAAGWNHYNSPEALALYTKFPVPTEVTKLSGVAANLSSADLQKSADEWEAERIREKYGV